MAELNPPWALENLATHHANGFRSMMSALGGGAEGVASDLGLGALVSPMLVTQRAAGANMSVDVAAGVCQVFGDEFNVQGLYGCVNDATKNVLISTADPTNPRRDLVVARVQDAAYSGGTNAWSLFVVTGTPAASPADPAAPNNSVVLARVAVAAAAASITNANITDLRPFLPLGVIPGNSARRPGVLYGAFSQAPAFKPVPMPGQMFYETDTNRVYVYNGVAWVCITPIFQQVVGNGTTTSTTYVALTGIAAPTVTVQTNTRVLVRLTANVTNNTVTDGGSMSFTVSGATTVAANDARALYVNSVTSGQNFSMTAEVPYELLNQGANTFTIQGRAVTGGTATFGNPIISVTAVP